MGEDEVQVVGFEQRAMRVVITARLDGKTAVEILQKFRQEGIGALHV